MAAMDIKQHTFIMYQSLMRRRTGAMRMLTTWTSPISVLWLVSKVSVLTKEFRIHYVQAPLMQREWKQERMMKYMQFISIPKRISSRSHASCNSTSQNCIDYTHSQLQPTINQGILLREQPYSALLNKGDGPLTCF